MNPDGKRSSEAIILSIIVVFVFSFICVQNANGAHIISGTIFDKARNALPDIEVELLDEYYRGVGSRQRTTSSGRYEFTVNNEGRYYVRVYAFNYDLVDETHEVQVSGVSAVPGQPGSSYNNEDFFLQPKRGGLAETELGVVFAQEVPKEAKKLFANAVDLLGKKKTADGILGIAEALKLYPDYYEALKRMTRELFASGKFVESFQYAKRIVDVNPKSALGYYYMGASLNRLGAEYGKASVMSLNEAFRLAPGSMQVLYLLGKVERSQGSFADAEKHLLLAKKLATTKSPEIHIELSQLYANDLKRFNEAADELEAYVNAIKLSDADEKAIKQKVADLRLKGKSVSAN